MTIKLPKAIEINANRLKAFPNIFDPDFREALKLLIEAGKRLVEWRKTMQPFAVKKLPGETEEVVNDH